jgi:hypothetical protein
MAWKQLRHQFWERSRRAGAVVILLLQIEQGKLLDVSCFFRRMFFFAFNWSYVLDILAGIDQCRDEALHHVVPGIFVRAFEIVGKVVGAGRKLGLGLFRGAEVGLLVELFAVF